jgi:hypothetical protein
MWSPPARIPDGDTVLAPGQRRWADLLDRPSGMNTSAMPGRPLAETGENVEGGAGLTEPTQQAPAAPLLALLARQRTSGRDR